MTKQVILLADAHTPPAPGLSEVLRDAGICLLTDSLPGASREQLSAELQERAAVKGSAEEFDASEGACPSVNSDEVPLPLAVLYEVADGANVLLVHAVVEHALAAWPGAPLVALRPNSHTLIHQAHAHALDDGTLKRLGFRAIAERPAQLPALLRELEERGNTSELRMPLDVLSLSAPHAPALPSHLSRDTLHAAFALVASLHAAQDQKSTAQEALAGLAPLVSADCWTIYLAAEMNGDEAVRLEPLAVHGQARTERESALASSEHEGALEALRAVSTDSVLALSGSESSAARAAAARMETLRKTERGRRILALPLLGSERVMGVLEAVRDRQGARPFTKREADLLCALAAPLASALANSVRIAEAERLSQTDDLTKLHNARYLRQFLLVELRRARRYGSSVSSLFFDIDDFKSINDAHGHLVGSHVLMEMAAVILSSIRDTDMVARYGGDEFVVVLPETPIEQAVFVAERVRDKIARHAFTGGRRLRLNITASFGVAAFPQHAPSPQQLVACADAAMYEAKAAGKNCIRTAL
ncbi:MAG TPA: GGDEF domain-containing protein [Pyrinomonadaceae bacterium]|jgi:diguanylate cyclase (GGDEF)-like protein|nr:GGDEF domain-containing protein [Pyrinomonadaceae bacterium]